MPPVLLLLSLLLLTALAWAAHRFLRHRHKERLRNLAAQWRMRYVQSDVFNLAGRIAREFPIPGASDLRVLDVIYATQGDLHHYLFTAEYTTAADPRHHARQRRAMSFGESREPAAAPAAPPIAAPEQLPLIEQYEDLHRRTHCRPQPAS